MNTTLRYGFELDRAYFIDISMQYQFYATLLALLTCHPIMLYLLIFENKTMKRDIRTLYILTHLSLILSQLSFSVAFNIYICIPYAAMYCEGPLCRAGVDKQFLMGFMCFTVVAVVTPFVTLMARMHQMFVPIDKRMRKRTQFVLFTILIAVNVSNIAGFGYYGRDYDNIEQLVKEPELAWLTSRGGTLFLFGPPSDPQHFKWALLTIVISMVIVVPFLIYFTSDAMVNIKKSSVSLSSKTQVMARNMFRVFLVQCLGALICHVFPIAFMLSTMMIDITHFPGWLLASLKISVLTLFTLNSPQFCIFFILKNPTYRKIVSQKFVQIISFVLKPCHVRQNNEFVKIAPRQFSVSSVYDKTRI